MKKIDKVIFSEQARILVTSDIHANLSRFQKLLIEMNYDSDKDYLIIVGDMIEKGHQNIQTLNFIMELEEQHDKVFVLEGNCDALLDDLMKGENLIPYLKKQQLSLINEWLLTLGIDVREKEITPEMLKKVLQLNFSKEIAWLQQRPTVLESDDFIFVHAGIPEGIDADSRETMLTVRDFQTIGHTQDKMVIVGHYPVVNYYDDVHSDLSIIINEDKRIISLDGGNQLDEAGQLNGLIIHKNKENIMYEQCGIDDFPIHIVTRDYCPSEQKLRNISWPYGFEKGRVLKQGEDFSECTVIGVPETCLFKNEYLKIYEDNSYDLLKYHTAHLLPVVKGEKIKIVDATCSGYLYIKKGNILGWIPKEK